MFFWLSNAEHSTSPPSWTPNEPYFTHPEIALKCLRWIKDSLPAGVSHNAICGFVDIIVFFFISSVSNMWESGVWQETVKDFFLLFSFFFLMVRILFLQWVY